MVELISLSPDELDVPVSQAALEHQSISLLDPMPIVEYVADCHGIGPNNFEHLVFVQSSTKHIRAAARPLELPSSPDVDRAGIEFLRIDMATPRLTTAAAMTWADAATKNVIDLERPQCLRYLRRTNLDLDAGHILMCTGRGFVLIRHLGCGLGVGFLESTRRDDDNFAQLRSLYPTAFSAEVDDISPFGNPC